MKKTSNEIKYWNGLRTGNEADLEALYFFCYDDLMHYGIHLMHDSNLSKEYINLVFANLWKKRNSLPEVSSPKAYIIASFRNLIIFRKKNKATLMVVYPGDDNLEAETQSNVSYEETIIELQELDQQKEKIQKVLTLLSDRQRKLMIARFMHEKSYEEIAHEFHIIVRTVYNSIHESLKILRSKLSKEDFI